MNIYTHFTNMYRPSLLILLIAQPIGALHAMRLTRRAALLPHVQLMQFSSRVHTTSPKQHILNHQIRQAQASLKDQKDLDVRLLVEAFDYAPNLDSLAKLIESGADVNTQDPDRTTPLHMAARAGNADMIRLLTEHGADVNAECDDVLTGPTPLHCATHGQGTGKIQTIKALIQAGANKAAQCKRGQTPLWQAVVHQGPEEIIALLTTVSPRDTPWFSITLEDRVLEELEKLQLLLLLENEDGLTVHQEAVRRERYDVAALLDPENVGQHRRALSNAILGINPEDIIVGI